MQSLPQCPVALVIAKEVLPAYMIKKLESVCAIKDILEGIVMVSTHHFFSMSKYLFTNSETNSGNNKLNNLTTFFIERTCPGNCTDPSQGTCNSITGVCKCKQGYSGEECNSKYSETPI